MFHSGWNNVIASSVESALEVQEFSALILSRFKRYADRAFHLAVKMLKCYFKFNLKNGRQRFLPVLKDWVSALSKR